MTLAATPSATIVLIRTHAGQREIFFLKRHAKSPFMANTFVFPGGRLDLADGAPASLERLTGVDGAALVARMSGVDDDRTARALVVAAIRETFEEAGLLLAERADGAPLDLAALQPARDALNRGDATFGDVLEAHDLLLRGDRLVYFDHWITPKVEGRRYDARFFLADAPPGQAASADLVETTEGLWLTAPAALARHDACELGLAPPTLCVLRDVVAVGADQLRAWAGARTVRPIEPVITRAGAGAEGAGAMIVALPGDPRHPEGAAPDSPSPARHLRWDAGRWLAVE